MIKHPFKPIYSDKSKILVLGSFPSVKSRENNFYYLHPQNRFWKILSKIFNTDFPEKIEDKKKLILENNLAIWDIVKSCDISGSSDSSIQNVKINDISSVINNSNIRTVIFNGKKAYGLYKKHCRFLSDIEYVCLPSTSPANAKYSLESLYNIWKKYLKL